MHITEQLRKIAVDFFLCILPHSAGDNGIFKALLTVNVGGEDKPALVIGNAHSRYEDGHCTIILNPDKDLVDNIRPSTSGIPCFSHRLSRRCDAAVFVGIDAYKKDDVSPGQKYVSRTFKPAKFVVA